MVCVDKKFWLRNPGALFSSVQIVPTNDMNLAQQMNALTRLMILIFLIMFFMGFKYSIHFFVASVLFLIILYYIQKSSMSKNACTENYGNRQKIVEKYMPPPKKEIMSTKDGARVIYNFKPAPTSPLPSVNVSKLAPSTTKLVDGKWQNQSIIVTPENLPFCNDQVSIDPPAPFAVNLNASLSGAKVNQVTQIPPVVTPPIYALDYWRDNNLIEFPQINKAPIQEELYLSGYAESTCCGYLGDKAELVPEDGPACGPKGCRSKEEQKCKADMIQENYGVIQAPRPMQDRPYVPSMPVNTPMVRQGTIQPSPALPPQGTYGGPDVQVGFGGYSEGFQAGLRASQGAYSGNIWKNSDYTLNNGRNNPIRAPSIVQDRPFVPMMPVQNNSVVMANGPDFEPYEFDSRGNIKENFDNSIIQPNQPGFVNTSCGYNPAQTEVGLPSNYPAGNCEMDPAMKQYNENLFTSIVTPGVYSINQINEPINSNIGISFQQQFEPTTAVRDEKGLLYTLHDPRIFVPPTKLPEAPKPAYDNVYDPRQYGYGTSYRSYIDPITGQPRFYYDDIMALRAPNYITRSKVDFLPYADSYGPMQEGSEYGNIHSPNIRALAQDSWFRDSLQFRNDMTERLMRKVNAEAWQKRQSPLGPGQIVHGSRR
jgi:hypothetical protein